MERFVLRKMPAVRIMRPDDRIVKRLPRCNFFFRQAEILIRGLALKRLRRIYGKLQIMLYHDICEKVVARDTAVFIRSLTEHQIRLCVRTVPCVSAGPEAGGFNEYGCGLMQIKFFISGFPAVFAQGIGYVRRDMNLAAPNVPCFTLFVAIERRHPGIPRSGSVHLFCMISGRVQRICTVQAQIFCGCFIILQEEREHKQVCIPEIAAFIPCMGQTPCTDGNGRIMCSTARHMTDRCRSWTRTQQGENMPILLKTQVDRTAKTPVTARRARVGGLCGFRSPADAYPPKA